MKASGSAKAKAEYYAEPAWCVDALIAAFKNERCMPDQIWDPACGGGVLIGQFVAAGCRVHGSDIEDRGAPGARVGDFATIAPPKVKTIVSNPPFSFVETWVVRAFDDLKMNRVVFLARLALLEGQKRRDLFWSKYPPARVWVCSRRPSIPPGGLGIKAKGGSIPFAWFDWTRDNVEQKKDPIIKWIP